MTCIRKKLKSHSTSSAILYKSQQAVLIPLLRFVHRAHPAMALSALNPTTILGAVVLLISVRVTWELLFSPLKAFPGPFAAKFTDLFRSFLTSQGDVDVKIRQWHQKWGNAVRIGPNAISLSDSDHIKAVYTTKNPWRKVRTSS